MLLLRTGPNVILYNKITKISTYVFTNIKKKKKMGGGVLIAHPKSKNASIPASCNGYSRTWF